jgi:hypothetical protein
MFWGYNKHFADKPSTLIQTLYESYVIQISAVIISIVTEALRGLPHSV